MEQKSKNLVIAVAIVGTLALIIGLVASSLARLSSTEVGVAYDVHQKILGDEVKTSGLHTGKPGFYFIKFPSVFNTLKFSNLKCLNKDGVEITINLEFQYRARPKDVRNLIIEFQNHENYLKILRRMAESGVHDACSKFNTTQFQSQRAIFQESVRSHIAQQFNNVSTDITDLQISNIVRPKDYETALKNKETAKENIQVAKSQRPRLLTQAETTKEEASAQAAISIEKAQSNARVALTKADADAATITAAFDAEADSYALVMANQKLGVEGLLAYLGTRVIVESKKDVNIGIDAPAKTKYTYT